MTHLTSKWKIWEKLYYQVFKNTMGIFANGTNLDNYSMVGSQQGLLGHYNQQLQIQQKTMHTIFDGYVAGVQHSDYFLLNTDNIRVGDEATLAFATPDEQYPNAISVWLKSVRIGYIPKEHTAIIRKYRDANIYLHVHIIDYNPPPVKPWHMFKLNVSVDTLIIDPAYKEVLNDEPQEEADDAFLEQ